MKDYTYLRELTDRYFEGLTSLKEEKMLRDYFRGKNIPEEWKAHQSLFRYFSEERQAVKKKRLTPRPFRLWASVAAACVLLFLGVKFISPAPNRISAGSMMYIDGKKYTDTELIRAEALKALENLSGEDGAVYTSQTEALDIFI
ncbi:MAG: hypothetical protein LBH19_07530 [Dysgonamonadaceae bacterium]|jgi:hypothetical protein|nr:hypothetical protein [Dysgonamonadaceae bacterium]